MLKQRFLTLLSLRLSLVQSRVACLVWWQVGLFLICMLGNLSVAAFGLPLVVGVFRDLDGGLSFAALFIYFAAFSVLNVHLLVARTADGDRRNTIIDPMELLPVPVEWNFYLTVIEEMFADPIALLAVPAAFLGVSLSSARPGISVCAALLLAPCFMALLAGLRITVARIVSVFLTPSEGFRLVRTIVFLTLLGTVTVAGCFIYDLTLVLNQSQGLEPLDLYSSQFFFHFVTFFQNQKNLLEFIPFMWPLLALLKTDSVFLFTSLSLLTSFLSLFAMGYLHRHHLRRPGRDDSLRLHSIEDSPLRAFPAQWLGCARPEVVDLEMDGAISRGAFTQALAEGGLLAGAWLLVSYIAPQIFAGHFINGFRFFCFMATLLLLTPAATIAREGGGVGLLRIMPLPLEQALYAKIPSVVARNVLVLIPGTILVALFSPPAPLLTSVGATLLIGLLPFIAAMAAIGGGMVVNPLDEGQGSFAVQIAALVVTALALAPVTIGGPALPKFYLVCGAFLATGLFIAGLWQKSIHRLRELSLPHRSSGNEAGPIFGDVTLGVLLFAGAANSVPPAMGILLPALSTDEVTLLSTLLLHGLVIIGSLLMVEFKLFAKEKTKWSYYISAVVLGLCMACLAIKYGQWLSAWSSAEASSQGLVRIFVEGKTQWALLAFVTAAIIGPCAEEFLFRRLLCCSLIEATNRVGIAILLSSLAFALAHSAATFPIVFLVGIISGLLMYKTKNVVVAMTFHVLFNASQLLYVISQGGGQ